MWQFSNHKTSNKNHGGNGTRWRCAWFTDISLENGEVILDGVLSAGVDLDELWDDIYIPNENEYKWSNENIRNETIPQEEIDDLLQDANDFLNNDDDEEFNNNPEESQENRSVTSLFKRLERRNDQEESG